ncbi:Plasmid stabilization system protein ParE [Ekhidna lutea]|uniref:Plasmid stabilization system protein ParE n=1 Tax=Ekhidna lutea TaxID=447679 RepID=A0A239HW95_EKHLU|nr:Plasmid stabilization system protein ParE [Ekhidna lutea]
MNQYRVLWSENAISSLQSIKDFIAQDSSQAALKVVHSIFESVESLAIHPNRFQLDEFFENNPGTIRRFFKWNYRIIYEVRDSRVEIIDIIHTSREPHKK